MTIQHRQTFYFYDNKNMNFISDFYQGILKYVRYFGISFLENRFLNLGSEVERLLSYQLIILLSVTFHARILRFIGRKMSIILLKLNI